MKKASIQTIYWDESMLFIMLFFLLQWIPTLSFKFHLIAITGYDAKSKFRLSNMTDNLNTFHLFQSLVVGEWCCEEKFIIFSSIKGTCGKVHIKFFSHNCSLIIYRNSILIYSAACIALLAYVHKL